MTRLAHKTALITGGINAVSPGPVATPLHGRSVCKATA
jgi:hypothetical protein